MKAWWKALTGSFGSRKYYLNLSRSAEFAPFFAFVILAAVFSAAQGWGDASRQKMAFDKALLAAPELPREIKVKNGKLVAPASRISTKLGDLTVIIAPKKFVEEISKDDKPCFLVGRDGWIYCRSNHETAFNFSEVKKRTFKIPELLQKETATRAAGALMAARWLVTLVFGAGFVFLTLPFLFAIFALVLHKRPGSWLAARVMISTMIPFLTAAYAAEYLTGVFGWSVSTTTQWLFVLTGFFCLFLLYSTRGLALALLGEIQNNVPAAGEETSDENSSQAHT